MKDLLLRRGWLLCWLLSVLVSYFSRNLMPIDETRYVSVAWEMWLREDWLVPYINGEPYSHKPPILFWLINSGWLLFGVNTWWPRLMPPLFALAGLVMTQRMARSLWPDSPQVAMLAPWILCSGLFWVIYTGGTMFDMLLLAAVMLALLGMLRAAAGNLLSGWLLVGVATGLGILIKGPVALLHIAFPALLGPFWNETAKQRTIAWYGFVLLAIVVAAAIALAWALPAAAAGGPAYGQAILWHQTADRMVSSFAHQRPFWWYLPLLPILLAPWLIWPPLWRAMAELRPIEDAPLRFLLAWVLPTLLAFSLISGKQLQYVLPIFPGFALLAARSLIASKQGARRIDQLLPALLLIAIGCALLVLPNLSIANLPDWVRTIPPFWGIASIIAATALLMQRWQYARDAVVPLAVAGTALGIFMMAGILPAARAEYDTQPAAQFIAALQEQGAPVAHTRSYDNQFQFSGRLKQPLDVIREDGLETWGAAHPNGYFVRYTRERPSAEGPQPLHLQRYRGLWLAIWPVTPSKN